MKNICHCLKIGLLLVLQILLLQVPVAAGDDPIQLDPTNPRWFQWRGKTVALITSAEHYGAVINQDFDFRKYLKCLEENGLNYTRIFSGAYVEPAGAFGIDGNTLAPADGKFLSPWQRSDEPGYFGGGNRFDLMRFNPAYLRRLNAFIETANQHGVVVELTLFCATYRDDIWTSHPFHPNNNIQSFEIEDWRKINTTNSPIEVRQAQERLVRWLVRELNHHDNLFYEIQNEPWADNHSLGAMINPYIREKQGWPNAPEITSAAAVRWQSSIAKFIRDEESKLPQQHLIAQNVANFRLALREDDLTDADVINFHYAYPESVTWNLGLNRVIGYDETGFAGQKDQTYRRQAWNFVLSGGALFNHLDYSFAVGSENGSKPLNNSPGGGGPELRRQLGTLSRFMKSLDLKRMKPDANLIQNAPGVSSRVLSDPGRQYAIYLEGRGPSRLSLNLPAGRWKLDWIDPINGDTSQQSLVIAQRGVTLVESPDFENEFALRIQRD